MSPRISVVVPTYNRSDLLVRTLDGLAAQTLPAAEFEVIVADDGSTDATAEVVRSYDSRFRLLYTFQEDRGFRAGLARNAGARLASAPVLAFLDTGVLPGPDYVRSHLEAAGRNRVVVGYTYTGSTRIAEAFATSSPWRLHARYGADPSFWDRRHGAFASVDFDMSRRDLPWTLMWSLNFSVQAADFWSAGGFDEGFSGWGVEDLELGYRLAGRSTGFLLSRDGWAIESPHDRDVQANSVSNRRNALQFLLKHGEPVVELCWAWITGDCPWSIEKEYRTLRDWTRKADGLHVDDEIRAATRESRTGDRLAIFGCGRSLPEPLPTSALFDFDASQLRREGRTPHAAHHGIGLRTALPDRSVDLVVVTSRLSGLWPQHGEGILAEAHRIGRSVWQFSM
jgi:glycosyltransferase involved in cell wall biosynthesis